MDWMLKFEIGPLEAEKKNYKWWLLWWVLFIPKELKHIWHQRGERNHDDDDETGVGDNDDDDDNNDDDDDDDDVCFLILFCCCRKIRLEAPLEW